MNQSQNPRHASKLKDTEVVNSLYPVVTKGTLQRSLADWQTQAEDVNQEVRFLCLGLTYARNARLNLGAALRQKKFPLSAYENQVKYVMNLLDQVVKEWPLTVK